MCDERMLKLSQYLRLLGPLSELMDGKHFSFPGVLAISCNWIVSSTFGDELNVPEYETRPCETPYIYCQRPSLRARSGPALDRHSDCECLPSTPGASTPALHLSWTLLSARSTGEANLQLE